MNTIIYRPPELGDENSISGCMWASADLWEFTDGTLKSIEKAKKKCPLN